MLEHRPCYTSFGWADDGVGVEIRNRRMFESEVLPLYFRHGSFASFIRQLHYYGFVSRRVHAYGAQAGFNTAHSVNAGTAAGAGSVDAAFEHAQFRRRDAAASKSIGRIKDRKQLATAAASCLGDW